MRILHVNTERTWRGGEQQVLYLVRGLAERGVGQALVCQPGSPLAASAREAGADVRELAMRGEIDVPAARRIARLAREGGFDVLHLHTSHAHALGVLAARLCGTARPRTLVARRVDFSIHKRGRLGLNRLKYTWGVDRIVCVSHAIRRVLVEDGLPPERLGVVHSGIDLQRIDGVADRRAEHRAALGLGADARLVGHVGHLAGHKGQRDLVEAMPAVLARVADAHALVVGEGEERADLEARIARLGLGARVRLAGFRDDVPSLLRAFDVFAFPSRLEGLGTSVLDALASRLPIVATRAGGIPEMIDDGVHGLLVPPGDPGALASALVRVLSDPELAQRLAAAGRARVEREFTWRHTVAGTIAEYAALLGETAPAAPPGPPPPARHTRGGAGGWSG